MHGRQPPSDQTSELFDRLADHFERGHSRAVEVQAGFATTVPETLKPAAVLIAITERAEPGVLLTHRRADLRQHAGQVAFPGGKLDPGEHAVGAALREAYEELAIDPAQVRVIGTSDTFITGTGYDITPVLAMVPPDLPLVCNPDEVSAWFEAPLSFVLDTANHADRETMFEGRMRPYIEIMWQEHRIWGVTAAIIANLARRLDWLERRQ
ncbi:CoA pyrophosphatase [Altererythrobacter sp. KTW20L]|uniref:CoA pyrophosphatase n=1 Tax=Altererythrobacter sp. KTW20L TaxID=2942210 RepID=UPI0020C00D5A|nr:CoA pyrophosphatase [Altererythrobacter sp. KTW20L]MCL6249557.1 CoA pyrophosphatase [Altererythrobacter sp. KTW20L]